MARVKISEYAAKKLFTNGAYQGVSVSCEKDLEKCTLEKGDYVVKVDDGTKKRNKKGLIKIGLSEEDVLVQTKTFLDEGYIRVLIEPMLKYEENQEKYISTNLVRGGVEIIYNKRGGNDIEDNTNALHKECISREVFLSDKIPSFDFVEKIVLKKIITFQKEYFASFVEVNPFVIKNNDLVCVDLAVEIDSAKLHKLPGWVGTHIQKPHKTNSAEMSVQALDAESAATFSLTVFDKDASVFTLLSGGGASLVVIDELVNNGAQATIANYGEYSGAPSAEETYRYTKNLINLMFESKSSKKVLLIAGGVANFTDVTTTFEGVIDACAEHLDDFKKHSVLVRVRRGGPRQTIGLQLLEDFFSRNNIPATVSDPSVSLSEAVGNVTKYLK